MPTRFYLLLGLAIFLVGCENQKPITQNPPNDPPKNNIVAPPTSTDPPLVDPEIPEDPLPPKNTKPATDLSVDELIDELVHVDKHKSLTFTLQAKGKEAVPPLVKALKDDRWQVRYGAAATLSLIGPDAAEALPALKALLENEKQQAVLDAAQFAVGAIEDK